MWREKLSKVGFWVVLGVLLFGAWAMSFTKSSLQTLGIVICVTAALSPVIEASIKTLLRAAKWAGQIGRQYPEN